VIAKVNKAVTVRQLYDYALQHNYLDYEVRIVLGIINRERSSVGIMEDLIIDNNLVTPANNTSTIDFNNMVDYSIDDLLTLLSL
jgi:hypothetical protein